MPRGIKGSSKQLANKTLSTAKVTVLELQKTILELQNSLDLANKGRDLAIDQRQSFEQIVKETNDSYGSYELTILISRKGEEETIMDSTFHVNTAQEILQLMVHKEGVDIRRMKTT